MGKKDMRQCTVEEQKSEKKKTSTALIITDAVTTAGCIGSFVSIAGAEIPTLGKGSMLITIISGTTFVFGMIMGVVLDIKMKENEREINETHLENGLLVQPLQSLEKLPESCFEAPIKTEITQEVKCEIE